MNSTEAAYALLDPASRVQYMLTRLEDRNDLWAKVTPSILIPLARTYGVPKVIAAIEDVYEARNVQVKNPVAYLTGVLKAEDRGA